MRNDNPYSGSPDRPGNQRDTVDLGGDGERLSIVDGSPLRSRPALYDWTSTRLAPVLRVTLRVYRRARRAGITGIAAVVVPALFVAAVFLLMSDTAPKNAALAKAKALQAQQPQLEYVLNATDSDSSVPPETNQPVKMPKVHIPDALQIITYTVKPGDTISAIAQKYGISEETIISFNGVEDARFIQPGMKLEIPTVNGILYRVHPGDTLGHIAKSHDVGIQNILDINHLTSTVLFPRQELFLPGAHMNTYAYRKAIGTLFIWPTRGVITSPFGMRRDPFTGTMEFHAGIDIANSIGTPVDAAMDGRVIYVGHDRGYGNYILLDNGGGYRTLYAHLFVQLVSWGEWVHSGEEIGKMGDTGYSTGPHLHFAIFKNFVPVNPLNYLP